MLQHSDGFDSHLTGAATLSDGDPGWTSQSGVTITATNGKFGGKSLRRAAATLGYAAFSNPGAQKGFAAYFQTGTFGGAAVTDLLSTSGAASLVSVNQAGDIVVKDGGGTTRITALAALPAGTANWIEVDYLTAGIALYSNGVQIGSYTGAYSALGSTFRLLGAAPANTPITDVDDFITWDADGSYFNTFNLGPRRIQLLNPDGAGASTQWTPASGTNWAAVADTDWSGGVGVTADSAGLKDLYSLSDLAVNSATINAVVVKTKVSNTGDNPANLSHVVRGSDGSEAASSLQPVAPTAAVLKSVFYRDPAGAVWSPGVVNSLQAGQTSSN